MILEPDEIRVEPSEYRLFDHMIIGLELEGIQKLSLPIKTTNQCRARISIGPVSNNDHMVLVSVVTQDFTLGAIPGIREVASYWSRVRDQGGKPKFSEPLLVYNKYSAKGLEVIFNFVDGKIKNLTLNLGDLAVKGDLPSDFDLTAYFGETSKLED